MKNSVKICLLSLTLLSSLSLQAKELKLNDVKSINLESGETLDVQNQVVAIRMDSSLKNFVDFVELESGQLINSLEVKSLEMRSKIDKHLLNRESLNNILLERAKMGDGSGG